MEMSPNRTILRLVMFNVVVSYDYFYAKSNQTGYNLFSFLSHVNSICTNRQLRLLATEMRIGFLCA